DRVDLWRIVDGAVIWIDVGGSIQKEDCIVGTSAGNTEAAHLTLANSILLNRPPAAARARHQQGELDELSSVQRKLDNLLLADNRALRHRLAVQRRDRVMYFDE